MQELEALHYQVEYIKGKNNVTADCLSRLHSKIDEGINDENEHFERHLYSILDEEANLVQRLKQAQEADGVVSTASNQIKEKGAISEGQFKKNFGMAITNGFICIGRKIVVPSAMKHEIIDRVHSEGHFGKEKTTLLVRNKFYWRGMDADIEQFCSCCLTCLKNKSRNQAKEELVPIKVASKPREVVYFDVAYLPWSSENHRYFLLKVDGFSKFTELVPMPNQEAETIVNAILTNWIYRHGPPKIMISDQAPNVNDDRLKKMLSKFGVEKHSSPYHPQRDGQAERGIRSTKQIMRVF